MLSLERDSSEPFYQQIYRQIAQGIEAGLYAAGNKLPSIRACAHELGVSNTTIEQAYRRLTAEGYVEPRRGSGYRICELASAPQASVEHFSSEYLRNRERLEQASCMRLEHPPVRYDFAYDSVDPDTFPFTTWSSICREVFFDVGASRACLYNDNQGLHELRVQIARYLGSEFNLRCSESQLLIMPTTRDVVAEIAHLFNPADTIIAMENPGYDEVSRRLQTAGYELRCIPVCPYPAWEDIEESLEGVRLVFTTPACQFPTSQPMPIELRKSLVDWAARTDAYIIDDEYGWEFQTNMSRLPSLAALDDSGHVITLATFSNSFTPAVCLSYGILPPELMLKWLCERSGGHPQVPWQTQASMAAFIRGGHWPVHMRRIRTANQKKRKLVLATIQDCLGDAVDVLESSGSPYVLLRARDGRSESQLIEAAARAQIRVYPTSQYWMGGPPADWDYVLVGYAGISMHTIVPGIEELARAWSS